MPPQSRRQAPDEEDYVPGRRSRPHAPKRKVTGACPPSLTRPKHSAQREAAVLGEQVVEGKRKRQAVEAFKPAGAETRRPKQVEEAFIAPSPQEDLRQRSSRDKNGRWVSEVLDKRSAPSVAAIKEARQAAREKTAEKLKAMAMDLQLDKSWLQRKEDCFIAFGRAVGEGSSFGEAYKAGAHAADMSERTACEWIRDYRRNEGFFTESNWGRNVKVPSVLSSEEVILKSRKWWIDHHPSKEDPDARICDFHVWLCGDDTADPPTKGLLHSVWGDDTEVVNEIAALRFTHHLGFTFKIKGKGTFTDEHESEGQQDDRTNRFLPEYAELWRQSPSYIVDHGQSLSVDELEDLSARSHVVAVTGADGKVRQIDLGGVPPTDGDIVMLSSHDESCFKAGEYNKRSWVANDKETCMDKSDGPSWHLSCFGVEYGNGTICREPEGPPPAPILIKELREWHSKWSAGLPCELPATADVAMDPGSAESKDGWWGSAEFWLQVDLAMEIFEQVFGRRQSGSRYKLVAHVDWSQGHAAMHPRALNAESMQVRPGGKQPHLGSTRWVRGSTQPGQQLLCDIPRWHQCQPGCDQCLRDFDAAGRPADFQAIGQKGLKQVLIERGLWQHGMKQTDMVAALQTCSDFSKLDLRARAHVTTQMAKRGHQALFGVKYHAEVAWIERKWMEIKRRIRRRLNGRLPTLKELVKEAFTQYGVLDARKAARHCRETMQAYRMIGSDEASLQQLREEEIKMKGHRRVFDSSDGLLKLRSGIELTVKQKIQAHRTAVRRVNKVAKEKYQERCDQEWLSRVRRKQRASMTADQKEKSKVASKARKQKQLAKPCGPKQMFQQVTLPQYIANVFKKTQ